MLQLYPLVWFVVVCNFLVFFCFAVLFDLTFCSNLFIANLSAYLLPVLLLKIVVRQFFFFFAGGEVFIFLVFFFFAGGKTSTFC